MYFKNGVHWMQKKKKNDIMAPFSKRKSLSDIDLFVLCFPSLQILQSSAQSLYIKL